MAFLTLNGVTAKIVQATMMPRELGDSGRLASGAYRKEVRSSKRSWRLQLRPVTPDDGVGLIRILLGRGHGFPFDANTQSAGGLAALGSPIATLHSALAADGLAVLNEAKRGNGSIAVDAAATNLLTTNQATVETDLTGFSAVDGAALTRVTTNKWQATACVQVTTSAVVNAVRGGVAVLGTAPSTSVYTVSAYVMATSAITVQVIGRNNTLGTDGTPTVVALTPNVWQRISAQTPSVTAGDAVSLRVMENTIDSGVTFFVDGLMQQVGTVLNSWVDGSRAAPSLSYPPGVLAGSGDFTINAWIMPPPTAGTQPIVIIEAASGYTGFVSSALARLQFDPTQTVLFYTRAADWTGTLDGITGGAASCPAGSWAMVTAVFRQNPRAGQARKELWINGVMVASSTPVAGFSFPAVPDFKTYAPTAVYIGNNNGAEPFDGGLIDDVQILPFAASGTLIAAWFASTSSLATYPKLVMAGDLLRTSVETVDVKGTVDSVKYLSAFSGSTFYNNMRDVSCVLEEV